MEPDAAARGRARDRAIRRGGLATVIARLVMALASVLILAVAARSLDHREFGLVATLASLYIVVGYAGLGLGGVLLTRLAAARARDDHAAMRQLMTDAITALGIIGAALGGLGVLSVWVLPWHTWLGTDGLPRSEVDFTVGLFFVLSGISVVTIVGTSVLVAVQRLATDQIWTAIGGLAAMLLAIGAAALDLPPWGYVAAITGGPALTAAGRATWAIVIEYPYLRPAGFARLDRRLWTFVKSSGYLGLINVAAALSLSIDVVVVAAVKGSSSAAVFSVASRMYLLLGTVVGLVGRQVWSALTEAITRGDFDWARSRYRHAIVFVGASVGVGSLALLGAGRFLARLWVGPDLVPPWSLFIIFTGYTIYITVISQASVLLMATERLKLLAVVGILQTPVNLVASILLTKSLGLTGPVVGSLITHIALVAPVIVILTRQSLRAFARSAATASSSVDVPAQ
jgi:O-antigen/teichoic acid export membrane protein